MSFFQKFIIKLILTQFTVSIINSIKDENPSESRSDNTMYQNYIFDLYGTLVDIHTNEDKTYLWDKMTELYGFQGAVYTRTELRKTYLAFCAQETKVLLAQSIVTFPEIQIEKVFRQLYTHKGITPGDELVTFTAQMFRIVATQYIRLYDGVEEMLQTLRENGKKIYLLSNAQYEFTMYELNYLGLTPYFDGIMISSCEGCKKPDKAFYEVLLSRYGLDRKESIMIGNEKESDIKGAAVAGIDSLYIASNLSPESDKDLPCPANFEITDGDVRKILTLTLQTARPEPEFL